MSVVIGLAPGILQSKAGSVSGKSNGIRQTLAILNYHEFRGGSDCLDRESGFISGALPVKGGCPGSGLVLTFSYSIKNGPSSVELVGEGLRGGKVARLFHGKRPGARSASSTNPRSLPCVFHAASGVSSPSVPKYAWSGVRPS